MFFRKKPHSLNQLLEDCRKGKQSAQKQLYESHFNYAMSIALRYASGQDEAIEIVNDAFMKVFDSLDRYDPQQEFKAWFRKIVVYTAIDQYRKEQKHKHDDLEHVMYVNVQIEATIFDQFNAEDIMQCVQQLPPSYRTVFVMYVVEGYKHHEIAALLKISEGTSKSHLSAARDRLKKMLVQSSNHLKRHG